MNTLTKYLTCAWLLYVSQLLTGCGGGGTSTPASNSPLTSVPRTAGSLQLTLNTTKSIFARGETIPLTFSVKNTDVQKVTVSLKSQYFVVDVTQKSQSILSFPSTNSDTFIEYTVEAGASTIKSVSWDQTVSSSQLVATGQSPTSRQVPVGQYVITAYLPIVSQNSTNLVMNVPPANWQSFWQTNYASNPITITIR